MNPFGNPSDLAHLHLLLNHVPTIGAVLGVALFLLSTLRQHDDLTRFSLEALFVVSIVSLPAYMSGVAARDVVKGQPGVAESIIATHQSAALLALACMQLTGIAAWFALWQFRRGGGRPQRTLAAVFVLSVITLAAMAWTGNLGGYIRHPEISSVPLDAVAASSRPWLDVPAIGEWTLSHLYVWPAGETMHFLGMSLSFGILLVINLHVLGFMPGVPFATVHRLLPWGILGMALNVASGMMFFTAVPQQYLENPTFHWKVMLLMLAGFNYLYLTVFDRPWDVTRKGTLLTTDKVIAVTSLLLWMGALYLGRMLPYLRGKF